MGNIIDSRPVIRMNNYVIKGFEEDVGATTAVWATSLFSDIQLPRPLPPVTIVPFPCWHVNYYLDPPNEVCIMPDDLFASLLTKVPKPSTGCAVLWWLYHEQGFLNRDQIFGFSFFKDAEMHYFKDDPTHAIHNGDREARLIRSLCNGRL